MQNESSIEQVQSQTQPRSWCAIHTRYQHECLVEVLLGRKGFETFLPTYKKIHRWKDRKKEITHALFPGYVFVANAQAERLQVITTPGVCAMVSIAGVPATIPDFEIAAIRRAVLNPLGVEPHPYLRNGDFVRIVEGPFEGMQGILVRKKGSTRLVVSVELLGRAAAIEMDESLVRHIAPAHLVSSARAKSGDALNPSPPR
jgi:transcription antitermination factor NusG